MSPTALKLTLRAVRAGAGETIEGALKTEYRIVSHLRSGHDFFEGVRALLVDKDKSPKWSPPTLAGVTDADLDPYFAEPASGDLSFD